MLDLAVAGGAADDETFKSLLRLTVMTVPGEGPVCQDEDLMMKQIAGTAALGTGPWAPAARRLAGRLARQWGRPGAVGAGPQLPTPPASRSTTCQLARRRARGAGDQMAARTPGARGGVETCRGGAARVGP